MRRSTCLRSTNGAKATKSSTVRLPKLRSSNKHSGSKHIDYSGNSDGGDGDDKCNQKYISLVCNIRNNQPATKCCWVLWKLLFFLLFSSIFLVPFWLDYFRNVWKTIIRFFFSFQNQNQKKNWFIAHTFRRWARATLARTNFPSQPESISTKSTINLFRASITTISEARTTTTTTTITPILTAAKCQCTILLQEGIRYAK